MKHKFVTAIFIKIWHVEARTEWKLFSQCMRREL